MKLTALILLIACLHVSAKGFSQKIVLSVKDVPLADVLKSIEKQSGYNFFYDNRVIKKSSTVTADFQGSSLQQILEVLLNDRSLTYEMVDKTIVIRKKQGSRTPRPTENKVQSTLPSRTETPPSPSAPRINNKERSPTASYSFSNETELLVKGKVIDESGEPLPGVNILVKGTQQGTITDLNGFFSIAAPDESNVLLFSFVGYKSKEVPLNGVTDLSITMEVDEKALEEVVVVGYGTQRKRDLTGATSSVRADDYEGQAPRNVQDLLRSNAAGLSIGIATDAKGESSMSIRGKGTLTASNSPLIVLNNVIYQGALADINPTDILSIDILKDASAAAVFGSRAANGVIVITTKKEKKGKPVINFITNTGISVSAKQPKILDPEGFLKFRQDYNIGRNSEEYLQRYPQMFQNPFQLTGVNQLDWYNYDQGAPASSVSDDQLTSQWLSRLNLTPPEIENYFAGKITQWDKLVFQPAFQQDYNVSVSNATDNTSLYFSLGYVDREGLVVGDRYKNFRVRLDYETKITDFLTVGVNSQFASRNEGFLKSSWGQMTMISPYGSNNIDDPDSRYRRRPTGLDPINPFYDNLYTDRIDRRQNIVATLYSKVKLPLDIEYTMNFTPYYNWYEYYNHHSSEGDNWTAIGGTSSRSLSKRFNWQFDNILRWSKKLRTDHQIEITLLANAEKAQLWATTANASNYSPNDLLGYHRLQAGTLQTVSSDDTYQTGDALMGRLFYSFRQKYLLTASIRRDGYSAFGKQNPRAFFPSLALGWVMSEESFFKPLSWIDYAKLRFSWGENGNREIGQYAALAQMGSSLAPYIDPTGNVYTTSQIYVTTMANHNLKWERTSSVNLGIDFQLLGDKLGGTIEGYVSKTNDLLVSRALPNITGYSSVMSNLGQIRNKGLEINLRYQVIGTQSFRWNLIGNYSLNRRKIATLYGDMINVMDQEGNIVGQREANDETNQWFIGQDPDRIWDFKREGVWQLEEREEAARYGLQPGDFKYRDTNNDGIMNNEDKVFQGYKTPRSQWSLRSEKEYRNFRLVISAYALFNYYGEFQRAANNYSFPDRTSDYDFPRWTSTHPIDDYARIGSKNIGTNWVNRSFIRLENVVLSYRVPQPLLQKARLQALTISASVQNAGVFAPKWVFWDPESTTVTPRTFNFGLNFTL